MWQFCHLNIPVADFVLWGRLSDNTDCNVFQKYDDYVIAGDQFLAVDEYLAEDDEEQ